MSIAFATKLNCTKLVTVLLLVCGLFIFGVAAQTKPDKPMDAKLLAALVAELKGVVSTIETNEKKSALVAKKWDSRKDLAGKTRKKFISLLYEDVKSVINDSGFQYQIYSVFSLYKNMPDESPDTGSQKTPDVSSKAELVGKLIELTAKSYPGDISE